MEFLSFSFSEIASIQIRLLIGEKRKGTFKGWKSHRCNLVFDNSILYMYLYVTGYSVIVTFKYVLRK